MAISAFFGALWFFLQGHPTAKRQEWLKRSINGGPAQRAQDRGRWSPFIVVEAQFVKARQSAKRSPAHQDEEPFTGGGSSATFRSGEKMDGANVEERKFQFLYKEGSESFVFMDEQTHDQVSVPGRDIDEESGAS